MYINKLFTLAAEIVWIEIWTVDREVKTFPNYQQIHANLCGKHLKHQVSSRPSLPTK